MIERQRDFRFRLFLPPSPPFLPSLLPSLPPSLPSFPLPTFGQGLNDTALLQVLAELLLLRFGGLYSVREGAREGGREGGREGWGYGGRGVRG